MNKHCSDVFGWPSIQHNNNNMTIEDYLFCLGMTLKPFYILPSGSLQVGDAIVFLAFLVMLIRGGLSLRVERRDLLYLLFASCVCVINGLYFCRYGSISFLLPCLYYLFNFFVIIMFRERMKSECFLNAMTLTLRFDIYMQAVIYFTGLGRWFGAERYMGTFNDPNQLAFFILCSYVFILVVATKRERKLNPIDALAALFVILQTASTGMLLGIGAVLVVVAARTVLSVVREITLPKLVAIGVILCLVMLKAGGAVSITSRNDGLFVFDRLEEKARKLLEGENTGSEDSIIVDRQLDKIVLYPEKLLYGAGEGDFERFHLASRPQEIHSTLLGILWYYGILPYLILTIWILNNFLRSRMPLSLIVIYATFFIESCTLANQRQPLFWMLLVIASLGQREPLDPLKVPAGLGTRSIYISRGRIAR